MARDEFPARTKQTLAKRAGSICSQPECLRVTVGPGADPAARRPLVLRGAQGACSRASISRLRMRFSRQA